MFCPRFRQRRRPLRNPLPVGFDEMMIIESGGLTRGAHMFPVFWKLPKLREDFWQACLRLRPEIAVFWLVILHFCLAESLEEFEGVLAMQPLLYRLWKDLPL